MSQKIVFKTVGTQCQLYLCVEILKGYCLVEKICVKCVYLRFVTKNGIL